jgi:hypothetical protein
MQTTPDDLLKKQATAVESGQRGTAKEIAGQAAVDRHAIRVNILR